ncbi:hypothetical protein [Microbacterium kunmingense]|uniref:hypothetical protein n=1 Tax=Microbacterium kunmingense TaxID=2915939 RepID=UPI002004CD41|nr:hypothetical protein [Microbacterium kunmingense]
MTEIKPTAFKRGVPAEQANGLYGVEEQLIEMAPGEQIVCITTFSVEEVMEKRRAGEEWPVVGMKHLEPLWDEKASAAALKLRDAAYKKRTGQDALDIPEGDD